MNTPKRELMMMFYEFIQSVAVYDGPLRGAFGEWLNDVNGVRRLASNRHYQQRMTDRSLDLAALSRALPNPQPPDP
ncbi:hypothetical protein PIB30_073654 [Stylosanthes scabra]|uniref:Uncharacterized protein n=1 Tax=Stylosanthes scabra TaxID=79078 RepID=A0ABU6UN90_9FABA|nr:hypothetical protein [Stylosanthes scabra]